MATFARRFRFYIQSGRACGSKVERTSEDGRSRFSIACSATPARIQENAGSRSACKSGDVIKCSPRIPKTPTRRGSRTESPRPRKCGEPKHIVLCIFVSDLLLFCYPCVLLSFLVIMCDFISPSFCDVCFVYLFCVIN